MNGIRHLAACIGAIPLLIQGSGGNISVKDGNILHIKASGFRLSDALSENIFVPVSRSEILAAVNAGNEIFTPSASGMRPSIETPLHALIPQLIVLHLHMLDAVIHAALPDARERLDTLLAGLAWRLLPYVRPGLPLSRLVQKILESDGPPPDVLILKNHGIVVAADDVETAIRLVNELIRRLWLPPRPLLVPNIPALTACNDAGLSIPASPYFHALAFGPAAAALRRNNPLCPDQTVFLGPAVCTLRPHEQTRAALRRYAEIYGCEAPFVVVPECGVLFTPQISLGAEAMVEALAHVAMRAPEDGELEYLPDDCRAELASWEAEQWRKTLDRPASVTDVG